jgi:hypothetical protein
MPDPALAGGALLQTVPSASHGYVPAAVLVAFDPQPDPPARSVSLDLSVPPDPGLTLDGFVDGRGFLQIGFAGDVASIVLPASACGTRTDTVVWPATHDVVFPGRCARGVFTLRTYAADGRYAELYVEIVGHGYVAPGSLVGFNPQPDPPHEATLGLAVDFGTGRVLGADVRLSLRDAGGRAVDLQ